jgi:DNA-binding transcriptional LysR family regulator
MIDILYISNMELRHLRYFVGVAEELHFARAAQRLGISQPPLSQQIGALEQILGVRLFDRTSRSVRLTSAGKAFLPAARATLEQAERAMQVARRAARGETGELAIGFNASAPFVPKVARAMFAFREAYPEVRLVLSEVGGGARTEAIEDHSLDITFLRSSQAPQASAAIAVTPVLRERLFVAMRPDHPLAAREILHFADLRGAPMLVYVRDRDSNFTTDLFRLMRTAGVEPCVAQQVRDVSTLFGLAAAGVGITVFAESLCALQSAKLVYRPLADAGAITTLWMLHLREGATLPCLNFLDKVASASDAGDPPGQPPMTAFAPIDAQIPFHPPQRAL